MLRYILSYYNFELFRFQYIAEGYTVSLHCWVVLNPMTTLRHVLSCYIAEVFPILENYWCLHCLFTLLRRSQSWSIAGLNPDLVDCLAIPNRKELLLRTLCTCAAETFPITQPCWFVLCVITLLRCSQSWKTADKSLSYYFAELFHILCQCWDISCLITLLRYSQP